MNTDIETTGEQIRKPSKILVPIERGMAWVSDLEYVYQEKMDGEFHVEVLESRIGGAEAVLLGELMRGGEFYVFDCLQYEGHVIRDRAYSTRLAAVYAVANSSLYRPPENFCHVPTHTNGGEFLRAVLARGGEGVVRKRLDAPWGVPMEACKRRQTFFCTVTAIGPGQSVEVEIVRGEIVSGQSSVVSGGEQRTTDNGQRTRVPLHAGKCDKVRVGSILKVEGSGLTAGGKIREPRLCKDTPGSWLVRY